MLKFYGRFKLGWVGVHWKFFETLHPSHPWLTRKVSTSLNEPKRRRVDHLGSFLTWLTWNSPLCFPDSHTHSYVSHTYGPRDVTLRTPGVWLYLHPSWTKPRRGKGESTGEKRQKGGDVLQHTLRLLSRRPAPTREGGVDNTNRPTPRSWSSPLSIGVHTPVTRPRFVTVSVNVLSCTSSDCRVIWRRLWVTLP